MGGGDGAAWVAAAREGVGVRAGVAVREDAAGRGRVAVREGPAAREGAAFLALALAAPLVRLLELPLLAVRAVLGADPLRAVAFLVLVGGAALRRCFANLFASCGADRRLEN